MPYINLTPAERQKMQAARREHNKILKTLAYERLGKVCCECGTEDTAKIRFHNPRDPRKPALSRHPAILHGRLLKDPAVAALVGLYCRPCRAKLRYRGLAEALTTTPNLPSRNVIGVIA